jgi:predicted RNase H-like HicB family nuclease
MKTEIPSIKQFLDEKSKRAATVDVLENVMKVLFFYLEEEQEDLEEEGAMEDFSDFLWDITVSAMASTGISVIGKDEDGNYIAKFSPAKSVKEFLIKEDIGKEDHVFYEDYLEDLGPDSGFGRHDNKMMEL